MKKIILCADDYGQNEAISQAIIALIKKNHLSATSCMTTSEEWETHSAWLLPYKQQIDIGLHFNLTEGQPLSSELLNSHGFLPLKTLLTRAYWRTLDQAAIEAELNAQLNKFNQMMGQLPDFIDGHQHIHQFPMIRQAVFNVYEKRLKQTNCYLRSIYDPHFWLRLKQHKTYVKRLILQALGARAFKQALIAQHVPHNTSFAGVYEFAQSASYAAIFPKFLGEIKSGGLIMCHPGLQSNDANDVIARARYDEFKYLESDKFVQDCFANGVVLTRKAHS